MARLVYDQLHCELGNHEWQRPVTRGKKPTACPACKNGDVLEVKPKVRTHGKKQKQRAVAREDAEKVTEKATTGRTGVCQQCSNTFEAAPKGRIAKLCPTCRENPQAVKQQKQEATAEERRLAGERAERIADTIAANDALNSRWRGRSHNIADILDRLELIESRLAVIEEKL